MYKLSVLPFLDVKSHSKQDSPLVAENQARLLWLGIPPSWPQSPTPTSPHCTIHQLQPTLDASILLPHPRGTPSASPSHLLYPVSDLLVNFYFWIYPSHLVPENTPFIAFPVCKFSLKALACLTVPSDIICCPSNNYQMLNNKIIIWLSFFKSKTSIQMQHTRSPYIECQMLHIYLKILSVISKNKKSPLTD